MIHVMLLGKYMDPVIVYYKTQGWLFILEGARRAA